MRTDELEALLLGAEETPKLEFKAAMAWEARGLIKDMLAMANVQDGGRIIIGVADDMTRQGVSQGQIDSFNIDLMRDQVRPFAHPYIRFSVDCATDSNGLDYVVIDVRQFDDMPVICARDGHEVNEGRIYYRPMRGRAQSAPISNALDMAEILDLAVVNRMQRYRRLGFQVEQPHEAELDEELGGL
ncbi:MAG: ATP-binding protein [Beijerinckiaceae bacterium]|nr:ATP-binding protein [Beijerinckiaceae bacterium]